MSKLDEFRVLRLILFRLGGSVVITERVMLEYFDLRITDLNIALVTISIDKDAEDPILLALDRELNMIKSSVFIIKDGVEYKEKSDLSHLVGLKLIKLEKVYLKYLNLNRSSKTKDGFQYKKLLAQIEVCKSKAKLCDTLMSMTIPEINNDYYRMISYIDYTLDEILKYLTH